MNGPFSKGVLDNCPMCRAAMSRPGLAQCNVSLTVACMAAIRYARTLLHGDRGAGVVGRISGWRRRDRCRPSKRPQREPLFVRHDSAMIPVRVWGSGAISYPVTLHVVTDPADRRVLFCRVVCPPPRHPK